MQSLSPALSASLASDIYRVMNTPSTRDAINRLKTTYGENFTISAGSIIPGQSGALGFIKCRSAFGLCLYGHGPYAGHAVFVFRGTNASIDWLTNLNIGVDRSSFGQSLHVGFQESFKTMLLKVQPFIASLGNNKITHVHCIGHSLGGAIATLCAEYIRANTSYVPYVYTYGAPRVGLKAFADMFTSQIKSDHIFRVYHQTDIVPCIPFWPFVHAPTFMGTSYDYFIPSPGVFPTAEWHDHRKYFKSVGQLKWPSLSNLRNERYDDMSILAWLNKEGPVNFSLTELNWLDKAINFVIGKCLSIIGKGLTVGFGTVFTVMDQLSYILKQGVDLSKDASGLVIKLVEKILKMLGMHRTLKAAEATREYIRNILTQLYTRISQECQRILEQALIGGRTPYQV